MRPTIKVPNLRSESLGNALAAKVQSLAEPAGAKVRASTLPAALRFGLACVQHTAHSAQHTAHSAQRTAHSASCQYAAHMQWILLQGTKFGALKGGSTAYVQQALVQLRSRPWSRPWTLRSRETLDEPIATLLVTGTVCPGATSQRHPM